MTIDSVNPWTIGNDLSEISQPVFRGHVGPDQQGVAQLALFGSCSRGEARSDGDIDALQKDFPGARIEPGQAG